MLTPSEKTRLQELQAKKTLSEDEKKELKVLQEKAKASR